MATRQATYDDLELSYDDSTSTYDGLVTIPDTPTPTTPVVTAQSVSGHSLLLPQVMVGPRAEAWSKEEAERWSNRLRRTDEEQKKIDDIEEQEAMLLILSLLI